MNKLLKKSVVIPVIIAVVVIAGGLYLYNKNNQSHQANNSSKDNTYNPDKFNSDSNVPTDSKNNSDSSGNGGINSSKQNSSNTKPGSNPSSSANLTIKSGVTPNKPVGTFVSNHHPNLSGSPSPNRESSTCSTTPGATCQISFNNGSVTKSLPAKVANANGNAGWTWKPQSIGLTSGTWTVTATAKNGSKHAKAVDANKLVIQP